VGKHLQTRRAAPIKFSVRKGTITVGEYDEQEDATLDSLVYDDPTGTFGLSE